MRMNSYVNFCFAVLFLISTVLFAEEEQEPQIPYTIQIVSPESEETFQNSTQELLVTVSVTPKLREGDQMVLIVDGQEVGEPTTENVLKGPWLPRGPHTVQVKIISKKGPGAESTPVTYYQQRTSLLLPAS